MKKQFLHLVRNEGDAKAALSDEQRLDFIKKCEVYIGRLKEAGNLLAAQPLIREGAVVSRKNNEWKREPLDIYKPVQVGYYHILAENLEEAIAIAKQNPEFEYIPSATIEVRPVKINEEQTNFVYPIK